MDCKLLHIYDDVMNLYGEYANVAVLARYLKDLGHSVSVDTLSLYEKKDISGYDFYYMGAGTERKQKLALSQLAEYRDALHAACEENRVMLFTGNSFELLGATVTDAKGQVYEGLALDEFTTTESTRRIVGDVLAELDGQELVGFMNKCSRTAGVKTPLFRLSMGFGNEADRGAEGWQKNNCFGTHLTGPLLVKNPYLLKLTARRILGEEYRDTVSYPYMEQGFETTLHELQKRREATK